uniref:Vitellogenin 4 n=1 Tax=Tetranychus evansi TaxID=178897 RepID=A0A3G5APM0_9ACAR|nr:vitellogenin 4 [Tetranychus evansi]
MKIFLGFLTLIVASACAVVIKPRPLNYMKNKIYIYEYTGNVLTGIPSSSSLYSGTQLKADVKISNTENEPYDLYTMKLDKVRFSSILDEVIDPAKANFDRPEILSIETRNSMKVQTLERTIQFHVNNETQHLEWIEVHKEDKPWSLNIKKAIIEMFLVDLAGKQLQMNPDHEHSLTRSSTDEVLNSFDVYEPTSKGECETMYQVINYSPTPDSTKDSEKFFWRVVKSRNYKNCTSSPKLVQHNWERKGCAEYCKKASILSQNKMLNHYSAEKFLCSCDDIEVEPIDQQSTSTTFVECLENPYIYKAESNGKVVFDNHGTRFITYTNQSLIWNRMGGSDIDPISVHDAIRIKNITFSLYPYLGSVGQEFSHEIPVYNLLVSQIPQSRLFDVTASLLNAVANTVMDRHVIEDRERNQRNVAGLMQKVVDGLAHLDSEYIMKLFKDYCTVSESDLHTNTLEAVRRQLFLDAVSHVGTQNVTAWLEQVISPTPDSNGLFPMEVRQVIENLPLNVYAPTISLIDLLKKKVYSAIESSDWDTLSVYVVAYGKLIAKACPNTEVLSESHNEIYVDESRRPSDDWLIPENEKCNAQQTNDYIENLAQKLVETESVRGRILIAQALAHTGKTLALERLEPYVTKGFNGSYIHEKVNISGYDVFRTSVIYSLHQMTPMAPSNKRIRSLVLPVFTNRNETYDIRLAAFTVFMAAGPKMYELDSVAVSLKNETNLQVISMVRSILEETANLTQPCHQPLAKAAREIVAALPQINIDGVYSRASYNEWYSTDKSTGFFANGQFVTSNITVIPKHGYLSLGSHWKSLSNSWLTVAFQQQGLETALRRLFRGVSAGHQVYDPKTVPQIWKEIHVVGRNESEFMLKLFVKTYEQTSLFTMDYETLENAYESFKLFLFKFKRNSRQDKADFHWVRFYSPSTYRNIVPSSIGLPILATKQNRQIVSLRFTKTDFDTKTSYVKPSGSLSFKITPKIYSSACFTLSAFNQRISKQYGAHSNKDFTLNVPLNLNFIWNGKEMSLRYAVAPVFNKTNFASSQTNIGFIAPSYIGIQGETTTKEIQSLVPIYNHPLMQLKSSVFGMNLNLGLSTERPWFFDLTKIPCDGTVAWLLEKYNEMNQFNNNINLTLVQNKDFPANGITGSFRFERGLAGNYTESFGHHVPIIRDNKAIRVAHELIESYPSKIVNPAFFVRLVDVSLATLDHPEPTEFNSTLTLVRAVDYHGYWYKFNSTLYNKNDDLWTRVPRRVFVAGKLERPVFPNDLAWNITNSQNLIGYYNTEVGWTDVVNDETVEPKIKANGELKRPKRDPVIPEMERISWFHTQCENDLKNGNASNYACELLLKEQSYFNVVNGKIVFQQVEESVLESIRKVYSELKRSLTYYWKPWSTISSKKIAGEENVVNFEASYSNIIYQRPVISLSVQTPTEEVNFTKIFVPVAPFPSMHPTEYLKASPLPKDQTCTVMKDSIRTFDNVTYFTWIENCEFVVAMDCSKSQQFAVTVKGSAGDRSIRVFTPLKTFIRIYDVTKDSATVVTYDDKNQTKGDEKVIPGRPVMHVGDLPISEYHNAHQVFMHDGVVNVVLPKENIRVAFDGTYLKITTSPSYFNKTCGLCGNQDQEYVSEFFDPKSENLATDLTAFRNSYSLHECNDPNPCHDDGCYNKTSIPSGRSKFLSSWKSAEKKTTHPILKTLIFERKKVVCFSKFPQRVCAKGEKINKVLIEPKDVALVCLPKNHPIYSQYMKEAETRILTEVSVLETTETFQYKVPFSCVPSQESVRGI